MYFRDECYDWGYYDDGAEDSWRAEANELARQSEEDADIADELYEAECAANGIHESHVCAFLINRFNGEYGYSPLDDIPF